MAHPPGRKFRRPAAILAVALLAWTALAVSPPAATGHEEGGPGRAALSCGGVECHARSTSITANLSGVPERYTPGATYALYVRIDGVGPAPVDPNNTRVPVGGFDLSASGGRFSKVGVDPAVQVWGADATEVTHGAGSTAKRFWVVNWTAPSSGEVLFILSVAATNGDGTERGDGWTSETFRSDGPTGRFSNAELTVVAVVLTLVAVSVVGIFVVSRRADVDRSHGARARRAGTKKGGR